MKRQLKQNERELHAKINHIFYRRMMTKWASCSPYRNPTVNTILTLLPKGRIEYIIYHEMTRLKLKNRDDEF